MDDSIGYRDVDNRNGNDAFMMEGNSVMNAFFNNKPVRVKCYGTNGRYILWLAVKEKL